MRFYTNAEWEQWLSDRNRKKPDSIAGITVERFGNPVESHRFWAMAHCIASTLMFREPTLLWFTEWSIWESSENWHLYYRLRHSYDDQRLLPEAPGNLFLGHEGEDLGSFLQVAMLNGWGGYVLTHANYVNAFFSHDEYIDFFADSGAGALSEIREKFENKTERTHTTE